MCHSLKVQDKVENQLLGPILLGIKKNFFNHISQTIRACDLKEAIPRKICFNVDIVQRGGGLTRSQIVQDTFFFLIALFSEKCLEGVQENRGRGVKAILLGLLRKIHVLTKEISKNLVFRFFSITMEHHYNGKNLNLHLFVKTWIFLKRPNKGLYPAYLVKYELI